MPEPMEHSPEPWHIGTECDGYGIRDGRYNDVCGTPDDAPDYLSEADARRIVACINACKGIPNEFLESVIEADKVSGRSLIMEAVELAVHIQVNKANREALEAEGKE